MVKIEYRQFSMNKDCVSYTFYYGWNDLFHKCRNAYLTMVEQLSKKILYAF